MKNTDLLKSPFFKTMRLGQEDIITGTISASERCEMVKGFDQAQCLAALEHTDNLQATVRRSLEARLRVLEREGS